MRMHDKTQSVLLPNPFENPARRLYRGTSMASPMPAADLLLQSQREAVLIPAGHLFAHQNQQTLVPALPTCGFRFQCVMIGDDEKVQIGALPGLDDLRHRPGAIGMDGVDVDRADGFVKAFDVSSLVRGKTGGRGQGSGENVPQSLVPYPCSS